MKFFQSEASMRMTLIFLFASEFYVAVATIHAPNGSPTFLGVDASVNPQNKTTSQHDSSPRMATLVHSSMSTHYGKSACPCVGVDNLRGYSAATLDNHHVMYTLEAGASCASWDSGMHPDCMGAAPPQWCMQKWCYVDPCKCNLDILPKITQMMNGPEVAVEYQGLPAYWSYATCGGIDYYTGSMSKDACVMQKDAFKCAQNPKCAWDGKRCGGKEAVTGCLAKDTIDPFTYGEEDCRCVGLGGRGPGKAHMYIDEVTNAHYPPNVGSVCQAWEADVHPDCKGGVSPRPSWCDAKWCFVDPCKCKTKVPPKVVMEANSAMMYQGKTAYWSYATCGSTDTWSTSGQGQYCVNQKTEASCVKMKKCAWTGDQCMGVALATICKVQQETGILGMESSGVNNGAGIVMVLLSMIAATQ